MPSQLLFESVIYFAVLSKTNPRLVKFGVLRLVRDVLTTSGFVELTAEGTVASLTLNRAAPAAKRCRDALCDLLKVQSIAVNLGVT